MSDENRPPAGPRLAWGVKQSFRNYVQMTGGTAEALDGAGQADDGLFTFEPAPDGDLARAADGALTGTGRFSGAVKFHAHGGMLSVFMADPALEIGPDGAVLTVADSAARTRRVPVVKLDLAAATTEDDGALTIPAALTIEGSFFLGDHYPPFSAVDPVRLTLAG